MASHSVVDTIETEARPRHAEFTPDGREMWLSAEMGGVVQVFDPATRKFTGRIEFAPPGVSSIKVMPCGIRFTSDGKTAVVALGRANHIALVDVATHKVRGYVKVGLRPWHLALSADEHTAIVANGQSNDISLVDLASMSVKATVPAGDGPWGVALKP